MDRRKLHIRAIGAFAAMVALMLFTQQAVAGAAEGVDLCVRVIIPSLFPFFFVTSWTNCILPALRIPGVDQLARWLHIPDGGGGLLLLGLIGGYPVGAQAIHDTWKSGKIDKLQAIRLLGFCSNAGPAFIFGITRVLFTASWMPWILWLLHMLSAILTGFLLPHVPQRRINANDIQPISASQSLRRSLSITASVCGWIIVFKTFLSILAPLLSNPTIRICATGLLELSAGCLQLTQIHSPTMRLILSTGFLAFGGICVLMQTGSVTGYLGTGLYLPGKVMQILISMQLAILFGWFLFREFPLYCRQSLMLLFCANLLIFLLQRYSAKKLWKLQQM